MVDAEETKLKIEIDEIVTSINSTIKKIESVAALKPEPTEQAEPEEKIEENRAAKSA